MGAAPARAEQSPWGLGPHLAIGVPLDDFGDVSEVGAGLGLRATYELSPALSLCGNAAYLSYGRTRTAIYDDPVYGILVTETSSQGFQLTAGPQLTAAGRQWRPYVSAQAGLYQFRMNTVIPGHRVPATISTWAAGWNGGSGVQRDIGLGPWIDFGLDYHTIYDLPGPLVENPQDPGGPLLQGAKITAHEVGIRSACTSSWKNPHPATRPRNPAPAPIARGRAPSRLLDRRKTSDRAARRDSRWESPS
ncbi:MAG: outer membrane beta-barrel protein [Candidatus Eisenbacteria bacterium]